MTAKLLRVIRDEIELYINQIQSSVEQKFTAVTRDDVRYNRAYCPISQWRKMLFSWPVPDKQRHEPIPHGTMTMRCH